CSLSPARRRTASPYVARARPATALRPIVPATSGFLGGSQRRERSRTMSRTPRTGSRRRGWGSALERASTRTHPSALPETGLAPPVLVPPLPIRRRLQSCRHLGGFLGRHSPPARPSTSSRPNASAAERSHGTARTKSR